jgi:hypothetical protein
MTGNDPQSMQQLQTSSNPRLVGLRIGNPIVRPINIGVNAEGFGLGHPAYAPSALTPAAPGGSI